MRQSIAIAAAAAALSTFATFGLSRAAPQPVRRGQVDLSSPYVPPSAPKVSAEAKHQARNRIQLAQEKRERKAAKLRSLVASGALQAI